MSKKVAIVHEGEWGMLSQSRGDYGDWVAIVKEAIEEAEEAPEVRVVKKTGEALSWLDGRGVIIFVTRGMVYRAEEITEEYPQMRVILLTGLPPRGITEKVIIINKGEFNKERFQKIVLASPSPPLGDKFP